MALSASFTCFAAILAGLIGNTDATLAQASTPLQPVGKERGLQFGTNSRLRGIYRRKDYGFEVQIPPSVIAYGPTCDPSGVCVYGHGFAGVIATDKQAQIYVYPEFDPTVEPSRALAKTNQDLADYVTAPMCPRDASMIIVSSEQTNLGTLAAMRVLARCRVPNDPSETVAEVTFALRTVSDNETVLYQVGLTCKSTRYQEDRRSLEALICSFKLVTVQ